MGEKLVSFYGTKVKSNHKMALYATVIIGLFTHIYKFTNMLPNHDSLFNAYSSQNMVGSGRWLLSLASGITSYFDLPWINGLVSIAWIAVTSVIIVEIFDIKNSVLIILVSGVLVTFPAITHTFAYEYTADGYMIAMALSALPVFFTQLRRERKYVLLSACMVCLSCGIYQAYISFGLVLALVYLATELLENRYTMKEYVRWIFDHMVIYVLGMASYFVIWKVCMKVQGYEAASYQGINKLGQFSLKDMGNAVVRTCESFVRFFIQGNIFKRNLTPYTVLNILFIAVFAATVIYSLYSSKIIRRRVQFVLFLVCIVLIPFAAYLWNFASTGVEYKVHMLQSLSILYIAVLIWQERWCKIKWKNVCGILMAVIIANNSLIANVFYHYMQKCYEKSYATAVEMSARIHMLDDGTVKTLAFVGNLNPYRNSNGLEPNGWEKVGPIDYMDMNLMDRENYAALILSNVIGFELSYYIPAERQVPEVIWEGISNPVSKNFSFRFPLADESKKEELLSSDEVKEMGSWPAKDSIQQIGDTIVIKLSEVNE